MVTLFLHHLLTEDDYAWLKALIYARETGVAHETARNGDRPRLPLLRAMTFAPP